MDVGTDQAAGGSRSCCVISAGAWPGLNMLRELCLRLSRLEHRPVKPLFRARPTSVRISGSGRGGLWSSVRYSGPGADKPRLWLLIHWAWRQDLHEVLTALQMAGAAVNVGATVAAPPPASAPIGSES